MPNLGEGQARKSAVLTGSMWKGFPYALEQQGWRLGAFAVAYRSDLIAAVRRTTSVKRQNARLALESCSDDGRLLAVVRLVRTAISASKRWFSTTLLLVEVQDHALVSTASVWRTSSRQRHVDRNRHQDWPCISVHASPVHRTAIAATGQQARRQRAS